MYPYRVRKVSDIQISIEAFPTIEGIEDKINAELVKAAVMMQNNWKDNLTNGIGADGNHGGPYRNTGEAVASIDLEISGKDVVVFSDAIQVLIAEVGRMPGTYPPFAPISLWVKEKLQIPVNDPSHYPIVRKIQQNIHDNGLEPFAPMELAITQTIQGLEEKLSKASIPES